MKSLIITDLHLTDNPREDYRWNVFKFVEEELGNETYDQLLILGDLFDKKDKHKAELVNRLVDVLLGLIKNCHVKEILILRGNHDYVVDIEEPFLRFLGKYENITWINIPTVFTYDGRDWLFLPHSRNPETEWAELLDVINSEKTEYIFMHQSVIGSRVSNYHEMKEGLDPHFFDGASAPVISGDIHVPQELGNVIYIGTQHPVSFGDNYDPRMAMIDDDKELYFIEVPAIKRPHLRREINCFEDIKQELAELRNGDQVRITLLLDKNQLHEWADYKKQIQAYCKEAGIDLHDLKLEVKQTEIENNTDLKNYIKVNSAKMTSADVLRKFAQAEGIEGDLLAVGESIFKGEIQ